MNFLFYFSIFSVVPEDEDTGPDVTPLSNLTVIEGEPATFTCNISGNPTPTVQWYREGALIPQSRDFEVSSVLYTWYKENNTSSVSKQLQYFHISEDLDLERRKYCFCEDDFLNNFSTP